MRYMLQLVRREDDGRTDIEITEILYDDDERPLVHLNVGDGIWRVTSGTLTVSCTKMFAKHSRDIFVKH